MSDRIRLNGTTVNAPDPRPDLPGEVRGKRRGARRAKTRSVRRHSGLFAIGGVVVAGVLVAVVAQSVFELTLPGQFR